ncbi:Hint domain-containing protein [Plastorhodobacter daqingensis]|uniref:Hint domain-containing protein n=1 Tax=Plastorhodobacter daqingensis TaxID=1387281 RepID=A0ABW2UJJ4_9RHOB
MPYTGPIIFTGNHVAQFRGQPTNNGNPGDAHFAMNIRGAAAIGTADDVFRLVWVQNLNTRDETFRNGQFWAIQKYEPALDPDRNPSAGEEGWAEGSYLYRQLNPKPDLVAGLGGGMNHVVFEIGGGGFLILDISRSFALTATDLTYPGPGGGALTFAALEAVCYLRGTLIMTDRGEVPIEQLHEGDRVLCRFGGLREVRWIGHQLFTGPRAFGREPIRFAPGAIAEGMPRRTLRVTPGHAMLVGEMLVLAADLVNGITVTREAPRERWEYFQIDLGLHDLVLADGAWSESFADCANLRNGFDNVNSFRRRFPRHIAPLHPQLCLPRPDDGAAFRAAVSGVAARALALRGPAEAGALSGCVEAVAAPCRAEGWAAEAGFPGQPVALEVVLDDRVIGETLACLPQPGRRDRMRQRFVFEGAQPLTVAELRRLILRRPGDGAVLAPVPPAQPGPLDGHLDLIGPSGLIEGCARDTDHPGHPVALELWLDGECLGILVACRARRDLAAAGLGDCAFSFDTRRRLSRHAAATMELRRVGDGALLKRSAQTRLPDVGPRAVA